MMLFLVLVLSTITHSLCQMNFTGHKVLGLLPRNEKQLEFLRSLTEDNEIDAWSYPTALHEKMSIRVSPEVAERLENKLMSKGIDFDVMTDNVREIGVPRANKPAIWIDSGIHAREWVAPATSIYIIEQLVKEYDTDLEIRQLMETFDWYIFPVVNPDGYKYTWSTNRMWRKNRAPSDFFNPSCVGTDPNRNFDADFGEARTSNDSCADTFGGRFPFSEAESRAVRDGVLRIGRNLKAFITLHSYSQLWMTPYGTSRDLPPDYADHMRALTTGCNATQNVHGQYYQYGTISNTIYPGIGFSVDWAYTVAKVKYSFAVELRDTGRQGFMLSNSLIIPTAEENFAGIKAIAKLIKAELE